MRIIKIFIIGILLSVVCGCDRVYPPVICSGYTEDVMVKIIFDKGYMCVSLVFGSEFWQKSGGRSLNSIVVLGKDYKEIAHYDKSDLIKRKGDEHITTGPWLVTEKGLYRIPRTLFPSKWTNRIDEIEQANETTKKYGIESLTIEKDKQ